MNRHANLLLIFLVAALAALVFAGTAAAGWTWSDDGGSPAHLDAAANLVFDGWTWDDSGAVRSPNGWTWDDGTLVAPAS